MKSSELSLSLILVTLCSLAGLYTFLNLNRPPTPAAAMARDRPKLIARHRPMATPPGPPPLTLSGIAFGIAAGSDVWETRKAYIKVWWRPAAMRGAVWLDQLPVRAVQQPVNDSQAAVAVVEEEEGLPPLRLSGDTERFSYTYVGGRGPIKQQRQQLRICRVAVDTFRLGLPGVQWYVVGDDDTLFVVDNLVAALGKYDPSRPYYIGSVSETHRQNTADPCCTSGMAFGGAGYAISAGLAAQLNATIDACMERYADLYGGSTRVHACLLELGVPLTRETGLHQLDIGGDASGLLAAHPIAPLLSLHHIDKIDPIFPGKSRHESLRHLWSAAAIDSAGLLQQSVCYDLRRRWSVSVSWGYVVQITRNLLPPRLLELPIRTFGGWGVRPVDEAFTFRTRPVPNNSCERPLSFFMTSIAPSSSSSSFTSISNYTRTPFGNGCPKLGALGKINWISVSKQPTPQWWHQAPTRQCCRIASSSSRSLVLQVRNCRRGEITAPVTATAAAS